MGLGFTIYGLTGFNLVGVTNYLSKPSDLCFVHLSTSATREDGVFGRCHFQLQSNTIPNPLEALALHSF